MQLCFVLVLALLLCRVGCVMGDSILFDLQAEEACLNGCDFTNPSIWVGGVVPSWNDSVFIMCSGRYSSPPTIFIPVDFDVLGMVVSQANLILMQNVSLHIYYLLIGENAMLKIGEAAVLSNGPFSPDGFPPYSFIIVEGGTLIVDAGKVVWNGNLKVLGVLQATNDSSLQATNVTYGASPLSVVKSPLYAVNLTILTNTNAEFNSGLYLRDGFLFAQGNSTTVIQALFSGLIQIDQDAMVRIKFANGLCYSYDDQVSAISGTGQLIIEESQLAFINAALLPFNGQVAVYDESKVVFAQFIIDDMQVGSGALVTGNGMMLNGNASIYGGLNSIGAGITVSGELDIFGYMELSYESVLTVKPSSTVAFNIASELTIQEEVSILLGGTLTGDIAFPNTTTLNITAGIANIQGSLNNSGTINLDGYSLSIFGDLNQQGHLFAVLDGFTSNPAITVYGASVLSGTVSYIMHKQYLVSTKFNLLESRIHQIVGGFSGSALPISGSYTNEELTIKIDGSKKHVYVLYSLRMEDVQLWEWVVLGGVILLVIVGVMAFIKMRHIKKGYQQIN